MRINPYLPSKLCTLFNQNRSTKYLVINVLVPRRYCQSSSMVPIRPKSLPSDKRNNCTEDTDSCQSIPKRVGIKVRANEQKNITFLLGTVSS